MVWQKPTLKMPWYEDGDLSMEEDVVRGEKKERSLCVTSSFLSPPPSFRRFPPLSRPRFLSALKFSFAHPPTPLSFLLYLTTFMADTGSFP